MVTLEISDGSLRVLAGWVEPFGAGLPVGQWRGGDMDADGSIQMPWFERSPEMERFTREVAEAGFVRPVPWADWAGTPGARRLIEDPTTIADASRQDLVYLLTTIIRGERFSDGSIEGAYERGTLLAIAQRAVALLAATDPG